jgi:hypothetical protein
MILEKVYLNSLQAFLSSLHKFDSCASLNVFSELAIAGVDQACFVT